MEPLLHVIIPLIILIALYPKINKKLAIALLPLTLIIDFDFLLPVTHRFFFHNIFFIILVSLIIYLAVNKQATLIGLYYLLSHLILDIQKPGIAFLYPIIQKTVYIQTEIIDSVFNWSFKIGTMSVNEYLQNETTLHSYYLTTQATQFFLILLISILLLLILKKIKNHNVSN